MNWLESIDLYCERTGPELWSEPLNALSNLAFIGVAALLWRRAGGRHSSGDIRLLLALIAAVGIGSLVFHTLATRWAALLDIVFIALFVLVRCACSAKARPPAGAAWAPSCCWRCSSAAPPGSCRRLR